MGAVAHMDGLDRVWQNAEDSEVDGVHSGHVEVILDLDVRVAPKDSIFEVLGGRDHRHC